MARYTIEDINNELEPYNWKCISESYKNLNEELIFICEEGHKVYSTWGKIRKRRECPVCANNQYKNINQIPEKKRKDITRILALDQSTKKTGYAIFDDNQLVTYGVFDTYLEDEIARDHEIKMWLLSMINNWQIDFIGLEGIQYQQSFGVTTFETLARLQGILLELCYEQDIRSYICPTNTWRHHCGVKGRSRLDKKVSMQLLVKQWYDINVSDDVADAIGIGKYMVEKLVTKQTLISWE